MVLWLFENEKKNGKKVDFTRRVVHFLIPKSFTFKDIFMSEQMVIHDLKFLMYEVSIAECIGKLLMNEVRTFVKIFI